MSPITSKTPSTALGKVMFDIGAKSSVRKDGVEVQWANIASAWLPIQTYGDTSTVELDA